MEIVTGAFNLFGNVVKYTLISGAVVIATGATFAVLTKPEDKTFDKHLETAVKENIADKNDSIIESSAKAIAAKVVTKMADTDVKDYVVAKVGHVKIEGKDHYYVGAFQTWIPADKLNAVFKN